MVGILRSKKGKIGGKRYGGAHLFGFLSLHKVQTIEPTIASAAFSFPSASTRYSFLQLSGLYSTINVLSSST